MCALSLDRYCETTSRADDTAEHQAIHISTTGQQDWTVPTLLLNTATTHLTPRHGHRTSLEDHYKVNKSFWVPLPKKLSEQEKKGFF